MMIIIISSILHGVYHYYTVIKPVFTMCKLIELKWLYCVKGVCDNVALISIVGWRVRKGKGEKLIVLLATMLCSLGVQ